MTAWLLSLKMGTQLRLLRWLEGLLPPGDLLRERTYRRLWTSILISSFGGQVTMLALPLTAAVLLHASPTQMGLLTAMEIAPFVLFSLPSGVWLDRVRKLPVYVIGETALALVVASVPLAWWMGWLSIGWLYVVGFVIGTIATTAGSAAQIVLTQVVARERLVEAHAKNALAISGSEVAGPGLAGLLIKSVGAPLALLVDAALLLVSAGILRGIVVDETRRPGHDANFWRDLRTGVRFVMSQRLLVALACAVGVWQMCHHAAIVVQILFATRTLGLSEQAVGLSYMGMGVGTIGASVYGHRISRRIGPGTLPRAGIRHLRRRLGDALRGACQCLGRGRLRLDAADVLGRCGAGVHQLPRAAPGGHAGAAAGPHDQHHALADPDPSRPRCALLGGWLGEHLGLRAALAFAGGSALLLALVAWRVPTIRGVRELPRAESADDWLGAEADVRGSARGRYGLTTPQAERHELEKPDGPCADRRPLAHRHRATDPALPAARRRAARFTRPSTNPWPSCNPGCPGPSSPKTPDESEAYCRRMQARFLLREDLVMFAFERAADGTPGRFVAGTGLHRIDWDVRRFEIGYWRRSGSGGRGYVTEATVALARWAFDRLGARRVELRMDHDNTASWRVAERAGFTLEALLRGDSLTPGGAVRSTRVYARVRGVEEPV